MKYLYILKVGTTFAATKESYGDFDLWVARFFRSKRVKTKVIHIDTAKRLPNISTASGFIITGSHAMVTDELAWSLRVEAYVRRVAKSDCALLGICYGHQLIAKALGGRSGYNPKGKEIGTKQIKKLKSGYKDPLLRGIPAEFWAHETHSQTVLKVPKGSKVLAKSAGDSHQAVRYRENIWGVQFHPEFDAQIMREYIIHGHNDQSVLAGVKRCDRSSLVLKNFEKLLESK